MKLPLAALIVAAALSPQAPDSAEKWRQDVAVVRGEFLQKDKSFTPKARALAEARLDSLSRDIPNLTDQQIVAELARVAALADNPHTRAYLLRNRGWWRRYPIRIWRFSDGWRVIAVRPGQEALLGARIVAIGGKLVTRAEAAVRPLFAGPDGWAAYMGSYSLTSPDALLGTGVIRGDGWTSFEIELGGRRRTVALVPVDEPRRTVPEESWWFLSPAHDAAKGWVQALGAAELPPYLARPNIWYDLRKCSGEILYFPFSRSEDQPGRPTLAEFARTVSDEIARNPQARLVVDLRFNTGGNLQKTQRLFEALASDPVGQTRGRLFVILGPSTFSAGITPAAILRQSSKAIFVGSEPGDRLIFWAEGGNVPLPNSGITMHFADKAHIYGSGGTDIAESLVYLRLDARNLRPDRPALPSFADYRAGRDVAAERIAPGGLRCGG